MDRFFLLTENKTDIPTEIRAGLATFLTASYIIFVQPAVLAQTGMDFGAVMTATCLSAALGCLIMGLWANYPIALAPGMGLNFYFTYTIVLGQGVAWETALGAVFCSGLVLIILTVLRVREFILNLIPDFLKTGIAAGIGLFIAFIGFVQGGLVVENPATLVKFGNLKSLPVIFTLSGVILIGVLLQKKVKGAILIGMLTLTLLGLPFGLVTFQGVITAPPAIGPTLMKMDVLGALDLGLITVILVFVFVDLFDTAGTLVGISQQAGLLKQGKLPRATRAFLPDAVATTAGAAMGTSTVVCYIESSTGVAEGGRTGLTAVVVAGLFLLALFFSPIAQMIGGGISVEAGRTLYPITAPVLIIVGCLMASNLSQINWKQWDEALPAFLVFVGMPLTYSIADGMALGFITYPLLKIFSGKIKEVHPIMGLIAILFLLRYVMLAG
ncbi:MAG: NCS2 family permease [Nitrospinaceae bacterium]|nr:NCS2 family permease [Nitrospina sp.]MBT5375707.1 NCS2 family permease [Nitrospinaceae bacterium]MBT5867352.1 NCS2 family permease [Nitrospinaceae bacterium]